MMMRLMVVVWYDAPEISKVVVFFWMASVSVFATRIIVVEIIISWIFVSVRPSVWIITTHWPFCLTIPIHPSIWMINNKMYTYVSKDSRRLHPLNKIHSGWNCLFVCLLLSYRITHVTLGLELALALARSYI